MVINPIINNVTKILLTRKFYTKYVLVFFLYFSFKNLYLELI